MKMRQDQLALATGVRRRFVIDLEAGKPSCQLGRSLLVAKALGLDLAILASDACPQSATAPELPDVAEEPEEPDGYSIQSTLSNGALGRLISIRMAQASRMIPAGWD